MNKKSMKIYGLLSTLLAVLIAAGCSSFLTATSVISYRLGPGDINTRDSLTVFVVDLTEEEVWSKHKDDIKYIDNVGFELWLDNLTDSRLTAEFYIAPFADSDYVSPTEVKTKATRILRDLTVDPGPAYIDWPTSLGLVTNLDTVRYYAELGQFSVYAIDPLGSSGFVAIHMDSATVIVTVTYGR
jgi:hypothetical protein